MQRLRQAKRHPEHGGNREARCRDQPPRQQRHSVEVGRPAVGGDQRYDVEYGLIDAVRDHLRLGGTDQPVEPFRLRQNRHGFGLAGKLGGKFKTGQHIAYKMDTPMTNLLLAIMDKAGVHVDKLGDSTGPLEMSSYSVG